MRPLPGLAVIVAASICASGSHAAAARFPAIEELESKQTLIFPGVSVLNWKHHLDTSTSPFYAVGLLTNPSPPQTLEALGSY